MTKSNNNEVIITQARIQSETIQKLATLREAKKKIKEEIKNCYSELFTETMTKNVDKEMKLIMDDIAIVINDDLMVDGPAPAPEPVVITCQHPFRNCTNEGTQTVHTRRAYGTLKMCRGCFAHYRTLSTV